MKILHIVIGQAWNHENTREWFVAAYADAELAQRHRDGAQAWAEKLEDLHGAFRVFAVEALAGRHPMDPRYDPSSVQTTQYRVETVQQLEALPADFDEQLHSLAQYALRSPQALDIEQAARDALSHVGVLRERCVRALLARHCDPEASYTGKPAWQAVLAHADPHNLAERPVLPSPTDWGQVWSPGLPPN